MLQYPVAMEMAGLASRGNLSEQRAFAKSSDGSWALFANNFILSVTVVGPPFGMKIQRPKQAAVYVLQLDGTGSITRIRVLCVVFAFFASHLACSLPSPRPLRRPAGPARLTSRKACDKSSLIYTAAGLNPL